MPARDPHAGLLGNLWLNAKVLFTEPVLQGFLKALLEEPMQGPNPVMKWNQDESISSFIGRRLNTSVADNVVSALFHGIYAGDIEKLSAQTILGLYCELEKNDRRVIGSLLRLTRQGMRPLITDDLLAMHSVQHQRSKDCWPAFSRLLQGASVFTLKNGVGQLVDALKRALEDSGKVEILTGSAVDTITKITNGEHTEINVSYQNLVCE
jgi:oxygen-dependent protoporphyrinogen oxidase